MTDEQIAVDSPILDNEGAVKWLGMDKDYDEIGYAIAALHRLRRLGRVKATRCGRNFKWHVAELDRFTREGG